MKQGYIKRSETNPGAVLNTDLEGLKQYKKSKNKYKKMGAELEQLRSEVSNIKQLLEQLGISK